LPLINLASYPRVKNPRQNPNINLFI